jgi:hypothetical protein
MIVGAAIAAHENTSDAEMRPHPFLRTVSINVSAGARCAEATRGTHVNRYYVNNNTHPRGEHSSSFN